MSLNERKRKKKVKKKKKTREKRRGQRMQKGEPREPSEREIFDQHPVFSYLPPPLLRGLVVGFTTGGFPHAPQPPPRLTPSPHRIHPTSQFNPLLLLLPPLASFSSLPQRVTPPFLGLPLAADL